ncbi:MAG: ABC transporter substrate-binding protein [Moorea sp. SIOASIH]|uniref:ABC transporter substrate-binding protein n=1 Tax=Moorena sp. SIOASIH TaxID=2607817 RepID=UPI0013B98838|nr:ABC transporter substrate-binding protein [Moorena sp. SIOASIH]NEO38991.1 ABC transporter substrate-binding protein [Moorena sp. SIOASIH]
MNRVVILTLDGDLDSGIRVTLAWGTTDKSAEGKIMSRLAPNPEIYQLYTDWQQGYRNLEYFYRKPRLTPKGLYISSVKSCEQLVDELRNNINQWLNSRSDGFDQVRDQLTTELSRHRDTRILIQTDNPQLQRLPWHLWDVWENNHESLEFSLIPLEYQPTPETKLRNRVRLLAILGNSDGIDIETDRNYWQQVSSLDSSSCFLVEPTREELDQKLWEKEGWDILFFAGHSYSECNDETGRIYINQEDSIIINELIPALKQAIKNGLKLAIFNSCDGLGLANALAKLQMPQAIIMKEPVPDEVAQTFLRFFLEEFSQGKSLHKAVKVARKRLHYLENRLDKKLPYATWLPVICHHPKAQAWRWPVSRSLVNRWIKLAFATVAIVSIYGIYKLATEPNQLGDKISSGEEILDTTSAPRFKQRSVKLLAKCQEPFRNYLGIWRQETRKKVRNCFWTKAHYKTAFELLKQSWQQNGADPETLIYLNNALLEAQGKNYYTIAVVIPIIDTPNQSVKDANAAQEILRGIAQAQTEVNLGLFEVDNQLIQQFPGKDFLNRKGINNTIGLKVVIADDANREKDAKARASLLVKQSSILGVIGHWTSETTLAAVDTYQNGKLVLISPYAMTTELTTNPRNFLFRTVPTTEDETDSLVDYLLNIGQRQLAVFYTPQSPVTSDSWRKLKQKFETKGGRIIKVREYNLSKRNFNPNKALEEVRKYGETALVLFPDAQITDALENSIELIKANNGRNLIVGGWNLYSPQTLSIGDSKLLEKVVLFVPWHPRSSPNQKFTQDTMKLWHGPVNPSTATTYDATRTLIKALEIPNKPTRKGIQKTLASPDFSADGATGTIEFTSNDRHRKNPPGELVHIVPCPKSFFGLAFLPLEYSSCDQKH